MAGLRQQLTQRGIVFTHLQAQGALASGRQHLRRLEAGSDALTQTQPHQACSGQHDGVKATVVELAQPGVQVAAQGLDAQVGPRRQQLHHAAQAAGADHRALGQGIDTGKVVGDKRVARILSLPHRRQHKTRRQLHGHVLQRVHGQMSLTHFERGFQFLDEQTLAAHLGQGAVQDLVAACGHAQKLDLQCKPGLQNRAHVLGLPKGQSTFSRGDDGG